MKKKILFFILNIMIGILIIFIFVLGILRADRICSEANPDSYENYRFCMGI